MSSASKSESVERQQEIKHNSSPRKEEKPKREDPDSHKIFLSNLNGDFNQKQVEDQVRRLFEKYGEVKRLSLKKHKNGFYYFGFLEYPPGFEAYEAIKALDQHPLLGKNMKVRQDRQSEGCFYCKRMGHFARQCPENRDRRRSRSNGRRSRDRNDRRRDDRYDRGDRRDRDRDFRDRDRDRNDRRDRYERDREYEKDRHRHEKRRQRSRSYSGSRSSSESSYRRNDRKDKKDKRRRSRS